MKIAISAIVLALSATAALAETPNAAGYSAAQPTSALTRAEVVQQVLQARSAGTLLKAGEIGQATAPMQSLRSRERVRTESRAMDPAWAYANGYQPA